MNGKIMVLWLLTVSLLSLLIFGATHMVYRQLANDPQIQLAEDAASSLQAGQSTNTLVGSTTIDMRKSLAPFLIIFDSSLKPVASSVTLDGKTPMPPIGSLQSAVENGQNRFTWEPVSSVRAATVIIADGKGEAVLAGRSLREVEQRVNDLGVFILVGWAATVVAGLSWWLLTVLIKRPSSK